MREEKWGISMDKQQQDDLLKMDFFELGRVLKIRTKLGKITPEQASKIWKWWGDNHKSKTAFDNSIKEVFGDYSGD